LNKTGQNEGRADGQFPATRWSAIAAATSSDPSLRERALETLLAAYWKPVFEYIRLRWNRGFEEAQMNKIVLGILLGAILGAVDGMTAWFTPEVSSQLAGIIVGSTVKGIIAGVAIGFFARKVNSLSWGVVFGLAIGFLLAFLVARMQGGHYFAIILPGSIVGLIVGYATQRYGAPAPQTR